MPDGKYVLVDPVINRVNGSCLYTVAKGISFKLGGAADRCHFEQTKLIHSLHLCSIYFQRDEMGNSRLPQTAT